MFNDEKACVRVCVYEVFELCVSMFKYRNGSGKNLQIKQ